MNTETPVLSEEFQRLYCDATVFEGFSALHPISFKRVLPFQAQDPVLDDGRVLGAEAGHLADSNHANRLAVVEAYRQCGLLSAEDATNLKPVLDTFDGEYDFEFFELMGDAYANAGMFICALRWYRESVAKLEPDVASDAADVYASVGYCLYALGLFAEAVAWSKSCVGPGQTADTVSRALINYEAQLQGGCVRAIESVGFRTRYTVSTFSPEQPAQVSQRLKLAIDTFAPFRKVYIDWVKAGAPMPEIQPEGYPFQAERDATALIRHRMNLIFALCGLADELIAKGCTAEAKRLLWEAALLEPQADFIQERLKAMLQPER